MSTVRKTLARYREMIADIALRHERWNNKGAGLDARGNASIPCRDRRDLLVLVGMLGEDAEADARRTIAAQERGTESMTLRDRVESLFAFAHTGGADGCKARELEEALQLLESTRLELRDRLMHARPLSGGELVPAPRPEGT